MYKNGSIVNAADYFKKFPFYNKPIKKAKVKRLKNACYAMDMQWICNVVQS